MQSNNNDMIYKRHAVAFTVDHDDDYSENVSPMKGKDMDMSKGRRKRSERVKQKDENIGQITQNTNVNANESIVTADIEIKNVNTMDQFANFLVSRQSFLQNSESEEEG